MTKDNVTKASKAQTIKAPSALYDRSEVIDIVEEGNYKAQTQLRKAIYMYHTLISPRPREIEKKRQRPWHINEVKMRSTTHSDHMHVTNRRMSSEF